jgi:hypothetical protein
MLGAWMEMHNSLITSFYFSSFTLILFSIIKNLSLFYSLKSWSLDSQTHNTQQQQQQQQPQQPAAAIPHKQTTMSSFRESYTQWQTRRWSNS